MYRYFSLLILAALVLCQSNVISGAHAQQCTNVKLSQPVPDFGRIAGFSPVPDGTDRVAYLGDLETDDFFDLFTVPGAGGTQPVRFDLVTSRDQGLTGVPVFAPGGGRAVFRGDFDTAFEFELYSIATTDGGGTPVKLNGPLVGDVQSEFFITSDGQSVVYLAEEDSRYEELYVVPLLGGESRRLNGDLEDGSVEDDFRVSQNGMYVVYRFENSSYRYELFAAPLSGGAPFKLNGTMQDKGNVTDFRISPDGTTVIYLADQDTDNVFELYRVPLTGGASVRLSGSEVVREVDKFEISPDSSRVVFENERADGNYLATDLYSVPLAGGTAVRLNDPLPSRGFVSSFAFNNAGDRVVFEGPVEVAQHPEVFSVPVAGGTMEKLSGDLSGSQGTRYFWISPDDSVVVFGVDRDPASGSNILELHVAPLTGGTPIRLAGPLPLNHTAGQIEFDPSGPNVIYSAELTDFDRFEIFSVPLDGSKEPRRLNRTLPDGASVGASGNSDFLFSDDGRFLIFLADQETLDVTELWSVELACSSIFKDGFEAP